MTYIDDPAEHKQNLVLIFKDFARRGIKEMVFGGDIGAVQMNQWFFSAVSEQHLDLLMVPGNHDTFTEVTKHYHPACTFKCRATQLYQRR